MTQPWTPDGWRPGRHDAEPLTWSDIWLALIFGLTPLAIVLILWATFG